MERSSRRLRRAVYVGAVAVTAAGLMVAAVTSSAGAQPKSHTAVNQTGPGYPPPGGIYTPFTNCPLLNPLMQEGVSGSAVICSAGNVANGSVVLGNITTPVVRPVNVQFGGVQLPNASLGGDWTGGISGFAGGILPPPAGLSAMLKTRPDLIPESLTTALGCSTATDPNVIALCTKAVNYGGKYLDVYALAQSAGQITNFGLTTWTQRLKFKLINPLLGPNCYVGNNNQPIVVNPDISLAPGGQLIEEPDPNPAKHPNTVVLDITKAIATDTTFTAPGVAGCGPGGAANISIDEALDAGTGLPAASGTNSLTLNGTFAVADNYYTANQANILLSAFNASDGTPPARAGRTLTFRHGLSATHLHSLLRSLGMK